jgi:predicted NBD/HSP70 family sugar kinase
MNILVIDVGGTNVKVLATEHTDVRKIPSGPTMTAERMVDAVRAATGDWNFEVVSMGYPSYVFRGRPICEPFNLAPGWVGFDFAHAFGRPVKIINDAAMQALGSYEGGRMLFLGLGTGLGSAFVEDRLLIPMELAHMHYRKGRTYEDYLGLRGLQRLGKRKWRDHVSAVAEQLRQALGADYVVFGGGNAKLLKELPPNTRLGDNANAFVGGHRLWQDQGGIALADGATIPLTPKSA